MIVDISVKRPLLELDEQAQTITNPLRLDLVLQLVTNTSAQNEVCIVLKF